MSVDFVFGKCEHLPPHHKAPALEQRACQLRGGGAGGGHQPSLSTITAAFYSPTRPAWSDAAARSDTAVADTEAVHFARRGADITYISRSARVAWPPTDAPPPARKNSKLLAHSEMSKAR